MKIRIGGILFLSLFSCAIMAQQAPLHASDSANVTGIQQMALSDSSSIIKTDSASAIEKSVFDIYWVTNSIKSGWPVKDTAMIGLGLTPADTAYPFIMPTVGKLWRGCTYYHSGWDIGLDYGAPVVAGLDGKVRYARYCSGYGYLVIVRHSSGLEMYYAHLSKILVATDQLVKAGDTVGLGGATGRARGNHLHMEFRLCDRALDVADFLVQDDTVVNLYKIKETAHKQTLPPTEEYYTIVRGDTLSEIASNYGTTVTNLTTLNGISRNSTLRIGQRLRVR
jgi:murein DD-endopeptidase MepM/ murein hydrolase activator NlpD